VRDQEVRVTLSVPAGTILKFEVGLRRYLGRITRYEPEMHRGELVDYVWMMQDNGALKCLDCPEDMYNKKWDDDDGHLIIDENGIDINVNENGESFQMKIDEDGVKIKADGNRP
jgi:hypothetical protein